MINTLTANSNDSNFHLVDAAYDAAVDPESYDRFMAAWGAYVDGALGRRPDATSGELAFDAALASHFERASRIGEGLRKARALQPTPGSITAQDRRISLVLSTDGTVLAMSQAAIRRFGTLKTVRDLDDYLDHESIGRLRAVLRGGDPVQVPVAVLRTLSDADSPPLFLATGPAPVAATHPCTLIRALRVDWSDSLEKILAEAFRLTRRETGILRKLVSGQTLAQVAGAENRSLATLRTQLKTVFRKTGAFSQVDLVRLIATISTVVPIEGAIDGELARVDTGKSSTIGLRDGRRMSVNIHGPDDGSPVVFTHGMLDGSGATQRLSQLLADYRIRLICPVRPCFGRSDPCTDKAAAPENFAADLLEVLDQLGIDRAGVLGHMAGSVYAFAAAAILPDRISSVTNVSGGVPIVSVRQFNLMKRRQRLVALTARFMPTVLPWILGPGISQIKTGGEWAFMNALYEDAPQDHLVASDPSVFPILRQGYHFTVEQGHLAFEIDAAHVTRDWTAYVEATRQPIHLIHGAIDPVVHVDSVRDFQRRHPSIRMEVHPDAGQLLFYEYPELVIGRLAQSTQGAGRQGQHNMAR